MDALIKPVVRTGLMSFLKLTFGGINRGLVTPAQLVKQLFEFKHIGCAFYKRYKSKNAESIKVNQLIVMQLTSTDVTKVEVDASGKKNS